MKVQVRILKDLSTGYDIVELFRLGHSYLPEKRVCAFCPPSLEDCRVDSCFAVVGNTAPSPLSQHAGAPAANQKASAATAAASASYRSFNWVNKRLRRRRLRYRCCCCCSLLLL